MFWIPIESVSDFDMCGLVGIVSFSGRGDVQASQVEAMSSRIRHRGPDSDGVWLSVRKTVGLGHTRLSILELSEAGRQPMISDGGRFVLVFNGEVYNHRKLRDNVRDHTWRGSSDTESMLAHIERYGLRSTLTASAGMFSLALYDKYENKLFLVRDRFGEKPMYYSWITSGCSQTLIFGSEVKALAAYPGFSKVIDRDAVALYSRYGFIPAPSSIYSNVQKLPAGTVLEIDCESASCTYWKFWSTRNAFELGLKNSFVAPEASIARDLGVLLETVIGEQMIADVPVGAFLSGGVDSSLIVAMMSAISPGNVNTFTVGYQSAEYSEAEHARAVAAHLKTSHTELVLSGPQAIEALHTIPSVYDEPFADPSQLPTLLVAKLAAKNVKVALSGDGGDELFAGYNRYEFATRYWPTIRHIPLSLRARLCNLIKVVPEQVWSKLLGALPYTSVGYKLHKLARVLDSATTDELYLRIVTHWFSRERVARVDGAVVDPILNCLEELDLDPVSKMMLVDTVTYLADDILVKVDRAAMSESLETRAPFLDHRVAEFAWRIPIEYLISGRETKRVLKSLLYRRVPERLVNRPKMGFGFPIDVWLRTSLRDWAENLLSPARLRQDGYFQSDLVSTRWQQHISGSRNWATQLWIVLMFNAWLDLESRTCT